MKLIPAFRLHELGVAVWPVYGPVFLDKFSNPGKDTERCLQSARFFDTEDEAIEFVKSQPWPRFVLEPSTIEHWEAYCSLHPDNKYAVRGTFGKILSDPAGK